MSWRAFLAHLRPREARAHCDIPCGIYDPLPAQIAAMTVLRMHQLIEGLEKPGPNASKEELDRYENSLSRYVAVKEQHAELCKRELDILWHDYFKPEHLEKYPDLHNLFWNTIKLASKTKQEINKQAAEELVQSVQRIAEIFWETKGVQTHRVQTHMPVGGEYVLPAA
jgi:nickel superoxide dismutase